MNKNTKELEELKKTKKCFEMALEAINTMISITEREEKNEEVNKDEYFAATGKLMTAMLQMKKI